MAAGWTPMCAFCILARKKAELQAEAAGAELAKTRLPVVHDGVTMWQGIAVCFDHVVVTPSPPGTAARAAGLQL